MHPLTSDRMFKVLKAVTHPHHHQRVEEALSGHCGWNCHVTTSLTCITKMKQQSVSLAALCNHFNQLNPYWSGEIEGENVVILLTAQGMDAAATGQPAPEGETATASAPPTAEGNGNAAGMCWLHHIFPWLYVSSEARRQSVTRLLSPDCKICSNHLQYPSLCSIPPPLPSLPESSKEYIIFIWAHTSEHGFISFHNFKFHSVFHSLIPLELTCSFTTGLILMPISEPDFFDSIFQKCRLHQRGVTQRNHQQHRKPMPVKWSVMTHGRALFPNLPVFSG